MSTWPTTLPLPVMSGYSGEQTKQTVRTEMEVGAPRVRRRSAVRIDTVDVGFQLDADRMALFRAWFDASGSSTHTGTAQAGGASTMTLAADANGFDDTYNGSVVVITGGTGAGQVRVIADYVGSTKVATVDSAWTVQPDSTSVYDVCGGASGGAQWFTTELDDGSGLTACEARLLEWKWSPQSVRQRRIDGRMEVRYA